MGHNGTKVREDHKVTFYRLFDLCVNAPQHVRVPTQETVLKLGVARP